MRIPASGHAYFSLKDENAQMAAVMFRVQLRQLRFEIEDGMTLLAVGRLSVYEPRGGYQIILEYAEPKGAGALQIAFEKLKQKLYGEGLFDASRKQKIPMLPSRVGVITSPSGAVIKDILNVVHRRFANLPVDIYPVRVQGEQAQFEIAEALQLANRRGLDDLLILARGGGSLEDLAAFNSELVARAIAGSTIPVVSAIGHESDFTIADFVADLRAPTPSAAAELTVPVKEDLKARCIELQQRCRAAARHHVTRMRHQTRMLIRTLTHPGKRVQEARLHLDNLTDQLGRNMRHAVQRWNLSSHGARLKLMSTNPAADFGQYRSFLNLLRFKLRQCMQGILGKYSQRIKRADALIKALNPDAILQRGYSITRTLPGRKVVMSEAAVNHGALLEIQLAKGRLAALAQKPKTQERDTDGREVQDGEH